MWTLAREHTGFIVNEEVTQAILSTVFENPNYYLKEIVLEVHECTGRKVSISTIRRVIHKNSLTRKKIQCIAAQRNAKFRGDYVAEVLMYNVF